MKKVVLVTVIALVLGYSTFAHTALVDNGNGLIYDTDLNITWYQLSHAPDDGVKWSQAVSTVSSLTLGGVSGWRLPLAPPANGSSYYLPYTTSIDCYNGSGDSGYNITRSSNEMGHLFFTELGNKALYKTDGTFDESVWNAINPLNFDAIKSGPFTNLWSFYFTGSEYPPSPENHMFVFDFTTGYQGIGMKDNIMGHVLAVHSGNIGAPVPLPSTMLLLASGLAGFWGVRRKFKR